MAHDDGGAGFTLVHSYYIVPVHLVDGGSPPVLRVITGERHNDTSW